jgi:NAD(P)-dependent dehydrogenase (short-subunit alcohol dehydrogenase family)
VGLRAQADSRISIYQNLKAGFDAKFWAQPNAAKAALPYLSNEGSITFVFSISARAANPGTSGLAAIDGAIEAMIPPLAVELSPFT